MCKLKNHSIKIVKISLFFVAISFLISTCFAGSVDITPLNFLNKRVNSAEKSIESNKAKWSAVVKNLYNHSLKQADLLKMLPMLTSVKGTTTTLNDRYLCNLKDNDVINILFEYNDDFRKNLKNASQNFTKPTKNDMVESCWILNVCMMKSISDESEETLKNKAKLVDAISYCEMVVNDSYTNSYRASYDSVSLTKWNEWMDAFWNHSLKDSSYDILNDIYILSRILFDSPQEPEETLFYEMPDVSTTSNNSEMYVNIIKSWFSPRVEVEEQEVDEGISSNPFWISYNGWWNEWLIVWEGLGWDWDLSLYVNWNFDSEFSEFTYTTEGRDSYEFLGDNCIDEFTITWYDATTQILPNSEPTQASPWWGWWNWWSGWWSWWGWGWGQWGGSPANPSGQGSQWWGWNNPSNPANNDETPSWETWEDSCFKACEDIPCTASSCDRLACYMNCLCISYESPEIGSRAVSWIFVDNAMTPALWTIFRLEFCLQPVEDGTVSKSTKVDNLESTMKEIYTVIQNLRNSWQLMLNKKTKEYLDAGFQKNDFSKQISASINSYSKSPTPSTTEKQEKEKQVNLNTELMETLLEFEKYTTLESVWRNKYVIKWWAKDNWSITSNSQETPSMAYSQIDSKASESSLQWEHLSDMSFEVSEFLYENLNFWMSVRESLVSIDNVANALLKKKD